MFIQSLHLKDFLSFQDVEIELGPVNVLIGPNGSGKSNVINAIDFLRHCPDDLSSFVLNDGGAEQWIRWAPEVKSASMLVTTYANPLSLNYSLSFRAENRAPRVESENLNIVFPDGTEFLRTENEFSWGELQAVVRPSVDPTKLRPFQAFLSQYRSPSSDHVTQLSEDLERIRIYRSFDTTRGNGLRNGVYTTGAADPRLSSSGSNLAYALHELDIQERLSAVNEFLAEFAPHYTGIKPRWVNGAWTLQLREAGLDRPTPTERISDGTLKFLCLLAILLDPAPPPLICIDEPEAGLHPDAIALVSRAMEDAAERTQLIVTTHSEALVSRFSDRPEAVVVCEKNAENATTLKRQSRDELKIWLEEFSLGSLWQRGVLGGNR